MLDPKDYPNWLKACYLVHYLIENITKEKSEVFEEAYDKMLDGTTWAIDIGLNTKDEVVYLFGFTKEEAPEFHTDTHIKPLAFKPKNETQYTALCGIPYPALLAMDANKSKKYAFIGYIKIIESILYWQTIVLLNIKYNITPKPEKDIDDFNNQGEILAYTGQLLCMLFKYYGQKGYEDCINAAKEGKDVLVGFIKEVFDEDYASNNLYHFFFNLTDENYKKVVDYIEEQYNLVKEEIKE